MTGDGVLDLAADAFWLVRTIRPDINTDAATTWAIRYALAASLPQSRARLAELQKQMKTTLETRINGG